jgi:phosphate transport system substrate-binding protein
MRRLTPIVLLIALLMLAACGRNETPAPAAEAPAAAMPLDAIDPMAVTGHIVTAGSSTVYPLTEAVAEQFIDEGYSGNITIDSIGTGAGFERFCVAGETDIANASRPIRGSERDTCVTNGREPLEFRVGTDALAIVVNRANDWISEEGLTVEQIARIFSAETTNWSDIDPSWPAEPIQRFSPGTDSGTYDYFVEAVMDEVFTEEGRGEEMLLTARNLQLSEDDNVLVQGVEGNRNAIGYFGYAYFEENIARLRDVAVEGVTPEPATVNDGSYVLSRPLFIYSAANVVAQKPQVGQFIAFYLTNVNGLVRRVGYFPAPRETIDAGLEMLAEAMGQ